MNEWLDFSEFADRVQEFIDLGLYDEATALLDEYASAFVDEWEYYFLYSRIYADQNRPSEVIPCLMKGLRLEPTNVDCLVGLFYAKAMMYQTVEGGRYLLRAEKYHPDSEPVICALIWYYTELNDLTAAIACFERIRSRGTNNPETYRNGGIAFDRGGYSDKAIECYRAALELNPLYDEARELLSDLLIALGRFESALELYRQALDLSPNNIRYRSRLVYCLSRAGETEKALAAARESIALYPNSPIGYIDLAYVQVNSGYLDEAMASADAAQNIAPLDAEGFRVRAIICSDKGGNDLADEAFAAALRLDPENPETLRDYYHHLRKTERYTEMEQLVFRVIRLEGAASIEDYWFLADHYRERSNDSAAFRCLHEAFHFRPGEYDLLPPMIDIMLEKGHSAFAVRFLRLYASHMGWNDMMDHFQCHPHLQGRPHQEELRFLRFTYGNRLATERYLFRRHFGNLLFVSLLLILCALALPARLLFGSIGVAAAAVAAIVWLGTVILLTRHRRKKAFMLLEAANYPER